VAERPFPPLSRFVKDMAAQGWSVDDIDKGLKGKFGFGLKDVPRAQRARAHAIETTGMDPLADSFREWFRPSPASVVPLPSTGDPESAPSKAEALAHSRQPFEDKGLLQGLGETALTMVSSLPALAAGVADVLSPRLPEGRMADEMQGPTSAQIASLPASHGAEIRGGHEGYNELMKERSKMSFATASARSVGDAFAGGLEIGGQATGISPTGAETLPWPDSYVEGLKRRFGAGQQIAGGMLGGTSAMATGIAKDVGRFVTGQAPEGPAHGDFPIVAAVAGAPFLKGAGALRGRVAAGEGRLARIAQSLEKPRKPGFQPVETIWDTPVDLETAKADAAFFKRHVDSGAMTAEEAAHAMEGLHPSRARQHAEPIPGVERTKPRAVLEAVRNAFIGWATTGDLFGGIGGAAMGAMTPEIAGFIWNKLSPASKAHFKRRWTSASEQASPDLTDIAESAQSREVRSEVQMLYREGSALTGKGDVGFAKMPEGLTPEQQKGWKAQHTSQRPATTSPVVEPHFGEAGVEFRPTAEAAAKSAEQRIPVKEASAQVRRTRAAKKRAEINALKAGEEGVEAQAASLEARQVAKEAREQRAELGTQRELDVEAGLVEMGGPKKVTKPVAEPAQTVPEPVAAERTAPPVQHKQSKRSSADDIWEGVSDGQPVVVDAYHGTGGEGAYAPGVTSPALGEGRYHAFSQEHAAEFGSVSRTKVELRNPAVIAGDADLARWMGVDHVPYENSARIPLLEKARNAMEAAGHDGVIINIGGGDALFTPGQGWKSVKRTREIFDGSQVVEFNPAGRRGAAPPAKPPAEAPPAAQPKPKVTYPGDRVPIKTDSAQLEQLIDRVHEAANRNAPPGMEISRKWVARSFTDAMLDDGLTNLRDKRFRGMLAENMAREAGNPALAKQLQAALDEKFAQIMEHALGDEPAGLVLHVGPHKFNMQDMMVQINKAMDPAMRAEMQAGALERVGIHVGLQIEAAHTAQAIMNQVNRFRVPLEGGQMRTVPAVEVAARTLGKNEPAPMITTFEATTLDPKSPGMGDIIMANRPAFAAEVQKATGKPASLEQVTKLAKHFQEDYIPMPQEIRDFMNAAAQRKDVPRLPEGPLQIRKGFAETLVSHIEVQNTMAQAHSFWNMMTRRAKLGLTAFRAGTHINNITSNLVYQSLRLGMNPLGVAAEWIQTGLAWRKYLKDPSSLTAADLMVKRAIAKTGVADTNAIDPEISGLGYHAAGESWVRSSLKKAGKWAQSVYRSGDNIPKLHDAERTYHYIDNALDRMEIGNYAEMDLGKGRKARFEKTGDGTFKVGNKTYKRGTRQYADLVARGAVKPALDWAFDYGDLPIYQKKLRGIAIVGAGSPFFSWSWKAMDLPGKKGLMGHLYDFAGGALLKTNDLGLMNGMAAEAAKLGAKRLMLMNLNRSALDPRRERIRPLLANNIREQGLVNVTSTQNPLNQEIKSWGSQSMFGPSEQAWRGGHAAVMKIYGGDIFDVPSLGPVADVRVAMIERMFGHEGQQTSIRARRLRNLWSKMEAGELFSARDAMSVVGLSGGLLSNFFAEADRAEKAGQDFRYGRMFLDFTAMMMGGTPSALAIDIPAGYWDPASDMTTRRQEFEGGIPNMESVVRHMIRKVLGVGYSRASLTGGKVKGKGAYKFGITDRYLERAGKSMLASIEGSTKRRAEYLAKQIHGAQNKEDSEKFIQLRAENHERWIRLHKIVSEVVRDLRIETKEAVQPFYGDKDDGR